MITYLKSKEAFRDMSSLDIERLVAYDDVFDVLKRGASALKPVFDGARHIVLSQE